MEREHKTINSGERNSLIQESRDKGFMSRDNLVEVNESHWYTWLTELQKWLREEHNIEILIVRSYSMEKSYHYERLTYSKRKNCMDYDGVLQQPVEPDRTYEEALKDACADALVLIKIKNK